MSSTSTSLGDPPLAPLRQDLGLIGLVVLAVVTAVEATLAVQRARRS